MLGLVTCQFSKPMIPIHFLIYIFSQDEKERKRQIFLESVCIWTPSFAIMCRYGFILLKKNKLIDLVGPKSGKKYSDVTSATEPYFPHGYFCLTTGSISVLTSKCWNFLWETLLMAVEEALCLGPDFKLHLSLGRFEIRIWWAGFHPASDWLSEPQSLRLLP